MAIRGLLALLALPAEPAPRLSTPPLPPGIVCGGPRLELADVALTAETTYAQVVAAWGEPVPAGPADEISTYYLTCDARLWLSFEPDGRRRLTRAILFTGDFVPTARVILDNLGITRRRRCDQVRSGRGRPGRQIVRAWGPPDNEIGSGLVSWTYRMADGGSASVFPEGKGRFLVGCGRGRTPR